MTRFLHRNYLLASALVLSCVSSTSVFASTTQEEAEGLNAGFAATRSTVEALSGVIGSAILGGGAMFRIRLGEADPASFPPGEVPRGMAASEPSPWSLWATPVYTRVDNKIEPLLSDGYVRLFLAGIEYNRDDQWIAGLSVTGDWADITAIERQPPAADVRSAVTGKGYTVGPYFVYVLTPAWMLDISSGIGTNKLTSRSDGGTESRLKDDRMFVSAGATYMNPINSRLMLTGKISLSYSRDDIGPFVNSAGVSNPASLTELNQARLGGQLSYQMGNMSPFIGAYLIANDFSVRTTAALKPQEYSTTGQGVVGLNASSGPFYGAIAYQVERGRSQFRAYVGLRY